jgi:malonyl-CoA O-methyltransferase
VPLKKGRKKHRINILGHPMTNPHLDPVALEAALRRMTRQAQAPWLHAEVARRMAEKLPLIKLKPQAVLDWWGFLGAGHALLKRTYPQAQQWIFEPNIDWAERSKTTTRKPWWSVGGWVSASPINVLTAAQTTMPASSVQLVWANMMLHTAPNPLSLFEHWHRMLQVNGFVMFSCLGPGTLHELRGLYRAQGWPAPSPEFIDMHDLGDMLVQAGFADPVMDQETLTLRWQNPQTLLAELQTLGGNVSPHRYAGLRTPRWRHQLEQELQSLAAPDGTIGLTFEVAYGHAFKAEPRLRAGGDTVVSLKDMRAMVKQSSHKAVTRNRQG